MVLSTKPQEPKPHTTGVVTRQRTLPPARWPTAPSKDPLQLFSGIVTSICECDVKHHQINQSSLCLVISHTDYLDNVYRSGSVYVFHEPCKKKILIYVVACSAKMLMQRRKRFWIYGRMTNIILIKKVMRFTR